jgi:hypothetical protein
MFSYHLTTFFLIALLLVTPQLVKADASGTVHEGGALVHDQPNTDSVVTTLFGEEIVSISCQTYGENVNGPFAETNVWDYLPKFGGYVSDAYVDTGSNYFVTDDCTESDPVIIEELDSDSDQDSGTIIIETGSVYYSPEPCTVDPDFVYYRNKDTSSSTKCYFYYDCVCYGGCAENFCSTSEHCSSRDECTESEERDDLGLTDGSLSDCGRRRVCVKSKRPGTKGTVCKTIHSCG